MIDQSPIKIAITGAAGSIGYSLVFRIAAGDLFGNRPVELRLLELPGAMRALEGVAMELDDGAFGTLAGLEIGNDPARVFEGVNVAMLVGAAPRKKGMARSDLLAVNSPIFAQQGAMLADHAAGDLRVVVTGNPANTNALIAYRHAPGVPRERFSALTRLDHNRAVTALAAKARARVDEITRMTIWGNHSNTQYADVYNALINGRPATDRIGNDAWVNFEYLPHVAQRGTAVIAARGASSAASAASATIDHVRDWFLGTAPDDWTSMAVPSDGSYGVPDGLVCSFPVTTRDGNYQIVQGLKVSAFARSKIDTTVGELQTEAEQCSRP